MILKRVNSILGCFERETLRYLRDPIQTVFNSVFSNSLFLVALYLLQPNKINILLPGILLYTTYGVVASNTRMSLFVGRLDGTLKYHLSAPISRVHLYFIYLASTLLRGAIISACLMTISMGIFYRQPLYNIMGFLISFLIVSAVFTNIGILLALFYKNWNSFGVMESYIIAPLMFFSGCFFSLENVPEKLKSFFHINPFFHFNNIMRYYFSGIEELPVKMSLCFAIIVLILTTSFCLYIFATGKKLLT